MYCGVFTLIVRQHPNQEVQLVKKGYKNIASILIELHGNHDNYLHEKVSLNPEYIGTYITSQL